jgi:putative flippase GtrA
VHPRQLWARYRRPLVFGIVGIIVMLASYGELWIMLDLLVLASWLAYGIQTVISLELNFVLNHLVTYRDRRAHVSFWRAFIGFHVSRVGIVVPLNMVLFPVLVDRVHLSFYVAQTICLALTFFFNYLASYFIYRGKGKGGQDVQAESPAALDDSESAAEVTLNLNNVLPMVSVVVPVRNSQGTIRRLVQSLLDQDYLKLGGEMEIIIVGSVGDKTWGPIRDFIDEAQVLAFEARIVADGRDANPKRNIGLSRARGKVLALTDSDMEMPINWVSTGVAMLHEHQVPVVAGSMVSLGNGFWSDYVDRNAFGSKTPRMTKPYLITGETLGRPGYKLPITANVFLDREVFESVGGLHEQFTQTYDDYVWFRDIVVAGHHVWCDARLAAYHRHREGFRSLLREYWSAGCGLMDYMALFPGDGFSRTRGRQLSLLLYIAILGSLSMVFAPLPTVVTGIVGYLLLGTASAVRTKLAAGLVFPVVTLVLSMAFIYGTIYRLVRQSWRGVIPTTTISVLQFSTIETEAFSG